MARALFRGPIAAAVVEPTPGGRIAAASEVFSRALGMEPEACRGRLLADLLPPEGHELQLPRPGDAVSYRTHLGGVAARVDLSAPPGSKLVAVGLALTMEDADTAQSRALLALSRELSGASTEEELAAAVARALDLLFPGRSFCIRLLDPRSLALTSMRAKGRLAPAMRHRLALRRAAILKTGLSEAQLLAAGAAVVERDEPMFTACDRATAAPLVFGGALHGVVNLEYERRAPGNPASDEPLLLQVANQAALAARNLRTLEELTHFKTFLEDLIENANALIAVVNREREILVFNKALSRLTGYPRDEALGEDLLDLVPEVERRRVEAVLERGLAGESVTSFETRLRLRSGGEARIAVNTSAIYGPSGEVERVIAIGQDTTLLRALQERAEHSQRLAELGKLAAGVVHELSNPLTAVAAYSENLVQKLSLQGGDPGDIDKLRRIREAAQRLQRLSRDLMAYARPPTEQREPVDLGDVIERAAAMCEPVLKGAGARLERRLETVPVIFGQRESLVQVFVNLITNAAHALQEGGGLVRLSLTRDGGHVAARVRDDGPGMEPDVKRRIFEPFFTTKRDGTGTGLGLSIVQGIVSRHGGAISVESEPGEGTTFMVVLPTEPGK
jgi:PAS domain S-box-containing protein